MYIVRTYDKLKYRVTDSEALAIGNALNDGKQKAVTLQGDIVLLASISGITREEKMQEYEEEKDHKHGVLHDGTRVVKQFGEWFCMSGDKDEDGHYCVRPNIEYYPEVKMNCVPSVETYQEKYAQLPADERKALMCAGKDERRYIENRGMEKIGTVLEDLV